MAHVEITVSLRDRAFKVVACHADAICWLKFEDTEGAEIFSVFLPNAEYRRALELASIFNDMTMPSMDTDGVTGREGIPQGASPPPAPVSSNTLSTPVGELVDCGVPEGRKPSLATEAAPVPPPLDAASESGGEGSGSNAASSSS